MQYLKYNLCWLGWVLLISGCSHSHPQQTRFVKYAATLPPIIVPVGIKDPTAESYYPIPPVAFTAPVGAKPPLTPPGSQLVRQKSKVKLPVPHSAKGTSA